MARATDPAEPAETRRLIVGLGNPGEEYAGSRHNVGFEVLDRLAAQGGVRFERQRRVRGLGPVKARVARLDAATLLVKPWTYMNLSGHAVAGYARFFGLAPEAIFVIYDDLNLPLGRMRIRAGGSPGGHNGIKSLAASLGSEGFPRLRIGIAVPDTEIADMADPDFVLGVFSAEERELLDPVCEAACNATSAWIRDEPLEVLMSEFNGMRFDSPSGSDAPDQRDPTVCDSQRESSQPDNESALEPTRDSEPDGPDRPPEHDGNQ